MRILLCIVVPMVIYSLVGIAPAFNSGTKRKRKGFMLSRFRRIDTEHADEGAAERPKSKPSRVGRISRPRVEPR